MKMMLKLLFCSLFVLASSACARSAAHGIGLSSEEVLARTKRGGGVFNVQDFGAVGDGKTDNTAAIVKAVEAIAAAGSGQLYFPAGNWLTAPFNLTSRLTLFLDHDATILGSTNIDAWPIIAPLPSYGQGRDHVGPRRAALIGGVNLTDVVITGNNGTIDGQGAIWWQRHHSGAEGDVTRGHLIELMFSNMILMHNVTLRNSPFWTVHPYACEQIAIQHVHIFNPLDSPNTDGIDPDSCRGVAIQNCYISVGDDAIAIKSGWDNAGIEFNRPSAGIAIENLFAETPSSAAVCIGSEMSGGVANVSVSNLRAYNVGAALRIKTAQGRGGYVQNVTYENVSVEKAKVVIEFNEFYGSHPPHYNKSATPIVGNIVILNLTATESIWAYDIEGLPLAPIDTVILNGVNVIKAVNDSVKCTHATHVRAYKTSPPLSCTN